MLDYERLKKLFIIYFDFFYIENQVSSIDGRTFDIINLFFLEFERIIASSATTKIDELDEACRTYNDDMRTEYGTHGYTGYEDFIIISSNVFRKIFDEDFVKLLKYFYQSYEQVAIYTEEHLNDVLLVEFNDMLAHILIALIHFNKTEYANQNISRAKSHLYRASLDGYKEIIVAESYRDNQEEHHVPPDIKRDLFITRLKEINGIGSDISFRINLIEEYANLATRLMNMPDKVN